MMHNFIAYFRKGRDFLKSYWAKWPRKQVASFHGRTVKGEESNIFTCKPRSIVFKIFGLIKLNRFLSYTNHESGKFQSFYEQNCVTIQLTVRAWSHEQGEAMFMRSVLPAVLFLAWFIRRAARQPWLLGKFPPVIPASQYWDPGWPGWLGCHTIAKLIFVSFN